MTQRSFADEITAVRERYVEELCPVDWTPDTVFYAPTYPGSHEVDEGSPFCWWYTIGKTHGFLVCWPMGTRLRIQTHPAAQAHTWWLDPAVEIGIVEEVAA